MENKDATAEGLGQGGSSAAAKETRYVFGHRAITSGLGGSAKVMATPLDPDRQGPNDLIDLSALDISNLTLPTGNARVFTMPDNAHSYGLVTGDSRPALRKRGAYQLKPTTVLTVTRNISGPMNGEDSLNDIASNDSTAPVGATATWLGADDTVDSTNLRVMAQLNNNQGQLGLADGSGSQSKNADLASSAAAHHNARGDIYKGTPSGILDAERLRSQGISTPITAGARAPAVFFFTCAFAGAEDAWGTP